MMDKQQKRTKCILISIQIINNFPQPDTFASI